MIDFKSTYDTNGTIHFCNEYGETLKTYPMSELEKYISDRQLNIVHEAVGGTGMVSDPNTDFIPVEQSGYIDDNWFSVTEEFYINRNPSEFKSANKPNQLNSKKL